MVLCQGVMKDTVTQSPKRRAPTGFCLRFAPADLHNFHLDIALCIASILLCSGCALSDSN